MNIKYIFRHKTPYKFSVENAFSEVIQYTGQKHRIEIIEVPYETTGIKAMIRNILYTRKIKGDIIHVTGDINYVAGFIKNKNIVLTILDLVTLQNRKGLKKIFFDLFWFRLPMRRSKTITVISETIAKELSVKYPKYKSKINVVTIGVSESIEFNYKSYNSEVPRILQIGTKRNKNLERVIEAIQGIKCILLIVGKINLEQRILLEKYEISYENYYSISKQEVIELYKSSDIVTFLSTYEGFGMPILESQKIGRVLLTSNIEPMKSIAGQGACTVDPYSVSQIRDMIIKLINDKNYKNEVIQNGFDNSKLYSNIAVSEKYIDLYNRLKL